MVTPFSAPKGPVTTSVGEQRRCSLGEAALRPYIQPVGGALPCVPFGDRDGGPGFAGDQPLAPPGPTGLLRRGYGACRVSGLPCIRRRAGGSYWMQQASSVPAAVARRLASAPQDPHGEAGKLPNPKPLDPYLVLRTQSSERRWRQPEPCGVGQARHRFPGSSATCWRRSSASMWV